MLAVADGSPALGKLIYYNETKCKTGAAECLYAANFVKDADQLSYKEIQAHFDHRTALGVRVSWNGFRAFMEFHPSEHPDNLTLTDIAREYMRRLGFGAQPYLVYRHMDTAITHVHIVGTNILPDGDYISCHHIGRLRSEPIRKDLEKEFGLVPAGKVRVPVPRKNPAEQVRYGEFANWPAISDTLKYILDTFSFRSLPELNAILKLYNLTALTGRPGSRLHNFRGLLYQILDEKGKNRGVPIKASALAFKPTLAALEKRFAAARLAEDSVLRVRLMLDRVVREKPGDVIQFANALRSKQVEPAPVFGKGGSVAELHLVDMASKTVVGPADLGVSYTTSALRERLGFEPFVRDLAARRQAATAASAARRAQSEDRSLSENKGFSTERSLSTERSPRRGRHR